MQLFDGNDISPIHHHLSGRSFSGDSSMRAGVDYALDEIDQVGAALGVGMSRQAARDVSMYYGYAMDTIQQPVTTPQIANPIQFYQEWLPGIVEVVTAAQKADELMGRATVGSWVDEQIVQQVVEMTGGPLPYGDTTNTPLADWNPNFVYRTMVRFELGLRVGVMEQERAARIRMSSSDTKRRSVGIQLEITRNQIGFYGYNNGDNLTYGYLNDPNLAPYVSAPNGSWATATFLEIQEDLLTAFQALRTQSKGRIVPNRDPITLGVATSCVDYLAKTSDFGVSVWDWLKQFYGNVRVVDAIQLDAANGNENVFYVSADKVIDSGSDDQSVWLQSVPATMQLLGVQKLTKGFEEAYTNATAGAMLKRPYGVKRYTGI